MADPSAQPPTASTGNSALIALLAAAKLRPKRMNRLCAFLRWGLIVHAFAQAGIILVYGFAVADVTAINTEAISDTQF